MKTQTVTRAAVDLKFRIHMLGADHHCDASMSWLSRPGDPTP